MLQRLNMPYLLLFSSMIITAVTRSAINAYSKKHARNLADNAFFTFSMAAVSALIVLIFILVDGFHGVSWFTLGLGVLFGLFTFLNNFMNIRALKLGPLAFTNIIVSASGIIPALYGCLFLGEKITIWQIIGIVLMLFSVFFSVDQEQEKRKASLKWLAFTLCCFLLNGLVGICQKMHRASPYTAETNEYLFIMFFFMLVFSGIYLLILKKKGTTKTVRYIVERNSDGEGHAIYWKLVVLLLIAGTGSGLINMFNLYLSGVFDAGIFFPVMNGGSLLATVLLSLFLFKERFTGRKLIGLLLGILSLLFLLDIIPTVLRLMGIAV